MIGLDTSFLVAWAIPEHPDHTQCRRLVADAIQNGRSFGLSSGILADFIHVVTDPRRFTEPLAMADAIALADFGSRAAGSHPASPVRWHIRHLARLAPPSSLGLQAPARYPHRRHLA